MQRADGDGHSGRCDTLDVRAHEGGDLIRILIGDEAAADLRHRRRRHRLFGIVSHPGEGLVQRAVAGSDTGRLDPLDPQRSSAGVAAGVTWEVVGMTLDSARRL